MFIFRYRKDLYLIDKIHPRLWHIYEKLNVILLDKFNIHGIITSTWRQRTTDSGIHKLGRAIDVVPERPITEEEGVEVADIINQFYEYGDGIHRTCIWHDAGSGYHFHIQIRG